MDEKVTGELTDSRTIRELWESLGLKIFESVKGFPLALPGPGVGYKNEGVGSSKSVSRVLCSGLTEW